jgi:hypothetical protein
VHIEITSACGPARPLGHSVRVWTRDDKQTRSRRPTCVQCTTLRREWQDGASMCQFSGQSTTTWEKGLNAHTLMERKWRRRGSR